MRFLFSFAFLLILPLSSSVASDYNAAQLVDYDLIPLQQHETQSVDRARIESLNQRAIQNLEATTVDRIVETYGGVRINGLSKAMVEKVVESIELHPVVSSYEYEKYNRENVEIGFCFGRATYAHLVLLKMGVNKDAIRKAWVVGPMNAGVLWAFHVTTLVKGEQPGQWWAVDNFPGEVLDAREWFSYMQTFNEGRGDLRLYITEPQKFSVSLGGYDRVQMGLDLSRSEDWYQHYFVDLMKWFQGGMEVLESVGLLDLRQLGSR